MQELPSLSPGRSQDGGQVRSSFAGLPLDRQLREEVRDLESEMERLTRSIAPALVEAFRVAPNTAATLQLAAWSNPDRLRSESVFTSLCGVHRPYLPIRQDSTCIRLNQRRRTSGQCRSVGESSTSDRLMTPGPMA